MDLERAVYELYKDMPEGDADEVDTLQFDAAFALCNGVQAAEIAAQRLYSCSLFDVFDLYFRIPRANITEEICDIKLSKRVTMLPSHPMESVMNLIHLQQVLPRCSIRETYEKQEKGLAGFACKGGASWWLWSGDNGRFQIQLQLLQQA